MRMLIFHGMSKFEMAHGVVGSDKGNRQRAWTSYKINIKFQEYQYLSHVHNQYFEVGGQKNFITVGQTLLYTADILLNVAIAIHSQEQYYDYFVIIFAPCMIASQCSLQENV